MGFNEVLECKAQLYFAMEETHSVLLAALKKYMAEKGLLTATSEDYFDQLSSFVLCKKKELNQCDIVIERSFGYDFEAIDALNYEVDPRTIPQTSQQIFFRFCHDETQRKQIGNT